jgi:hypothetical protein
MRSPTHQERSSLPPRAAVRFRGESSQRQHFTPAWALSSSNSPRPIYDDNGVMWVPYQQSLHRGRGGSRRPVLDQISRLTQDRWTPCQSGQGHQDHPVRPPPIGGQTNLRRKVQLSPKQVYKPKIREEKVEGWMSTRKGLLVKISSRLGRWTFPLRKIARDRLF